MKPRTAPPNTLVRALPRHRRALLALRRARGVVRHAARAVGAPVPERLWAAAAWVAER